MENLSGLVIKKIAVSLTLLALTAGSSWAATVTDIAGREVTLPEKTDRILLGEGRLFYAVSLLEGQKPVDRIVGWQGDFRKLDTQTYAEYRKKFPKN